MAWRRPWPGSKSRCWPAWPSSKQGAVSPASYSQDSAQGEQAIDSPVRFQRILGIRFIVADAQEAIDQIRQSGGLVVVPAAPALKNLGHDLRYRESLLGADFAIADSTLMVLLWNLIQRDRIPKLSGLKYLRVLLEQPEFHQSGSSFWIMPTAQAAQRNLAWLRNQGIAVTEDDIYLAPFYGKTIDDPELLHRLNQRRPQHIILGLGGGTQEPLGFYLKQKLQYQPSIHGIGAAIGFLSGEQVRIPAWADDMGLGWLWRSLSSPSRYGARYWDARRLVPLLIRYKDKLPTQAA
jgi:N-acetylglucosaminyldiphosphoundecaprenol N-acetyl-beta-D-mannosaminyltransferase